MVDRIVRVNLIGDASSLIGAANQARGALQGMARVNLGTVTSGLRTAGQAAQGAANSTGQLGHSLQTALSIVGVQASIAGIRNMFTSLVASGMEYQGNLNTLRAVTHATNTQMQDLQSTAKALGGDITIPGASAATAAEAMKELAKGGLTVQQSMDAARGSLVLAAAAQVSAADAAEIQAKALNAFQLSADQAGMVSDVLANSAVAASGEITDMAMGLQQSATVAHAFGISIQDTATSLSLFAKNGVIGSDAGTSFKTMLTALASPTKAQERAMNELSLVVYDTQGKFIGMESITKQLAAAHTRLTTEQYNSAASTLFGTDAVRAANILGLEGVDGWNKMSTAVTKAGGAQELAAAQMYGLNGAVDRLVNVTETASLNLFEKLQPAMVIIVNGATKLVEVIDWLVSGFLSLPAPVVGLTLAVTGLTLAWVPLTVGITRASAAFTAWKASAIGGATMTALTTSLRAQTMAWTALKGSVTGIIPAFTAARASMAGTVVGLGVMKGALYGAGVAVGGFLNAMRLAFLSNPFGLALTALTIAMTLFAFSTDDATQEVGDLSAAIDENTGKFKDNAAAIIQAATPGAIDNYTELTNKYTELANQSGVWTAALMGEPEALNRVHDSLLTVVEQEVQLSGAYLYAQQSGEAAGMTARQYASALLAGTRQTTYTTSAMEKAFRASEEFAHGQDVLGTKVTQTKEGLKEQDAANRILEESGKEQAASAEDQAAAIKKVNDELGDSNAAIAFKTNMDKARKATEFADLAAQSLTYSLITQSGSQLTANQAARANAAAMRMMATAARQHRNALSDVTEKEKELQNLQENGTADPDAIARAQKSVEDAMRNAQEAREDVTKRQQDGAESEADAIKAVQKAQEQAAQSVADANERVADAQQSVADAISAVQKAQAALNIAQGGSDADEIAAAQEKLADAQRAQGDKAKALAKAQAEVGTASRDAAEQVADAQERVEKARAGQGESAEDAARRVADADQSVADAQADLAKEQEKTQATGEQLADASNAIADAQDSVASTADAQADAIDKAGQSARDMAAAAYAQAVAQGDLAGAAGAATAAMTEQEQKFRDAAAAAGLLPEEIDAIVKEQGLIPALVTTTYEQAGVDGAIERAEKLNKALDQINGKTVTYTVVGNQVYQNRTPGITPSISTDTLKLLHGDMTQAQNEANAKAAIMGYSPYDYILGRPGLMDWTPGKTTDWSDYVRPPGRADGGPIFGPGGPRSDLIPIMASNGEFVVNAAATARNFGLLTAINGGKGFRDGGYVGGNSGMGISLFGAIATPDVQAFMDAWGGIAMLINGYWQMFISPALDGFAVDMANVGKINQLTVEKLIRPAWQATGNLVEGAYKVSIQPSLLQFGLGTQLVGQQQITLRDQNVIPAWAGIVRAIAVSVDLIVGTGFHALVSGMATVGQANAILAQITDVAWGQMGVKIMTTYAQSIVPAWVGVQSFYAIMGAFFNGIAAGVKGSADSSIADIARITTAIDEFFKMVDGRAPVAAAGVGITVGTGAAALALADGGYINVGTGPRADDVHIRASKGEYVVNAQATAENRALLDQINYGGAYADGGVVLGAIGTRVQNAITGGMQRAMERGVERIMSSVAAGVGGQGSGGYTSNGNYGPVNLSGFAENTAAAKAYIEGHFAGVSSIGGLYGGSVSGSDHPYGKALDVMIADYKSAAGITSGTTIADWFRSNIAAFGSKYVIWRDQIDYLNGKGWQPYQHPSGSDDTLQHRDHVHISFQTGAPGFAGQAVAPVAADDDPSKSPWLAKVLAKIKAGGTGAATAADGLGLVTAAPGVWGTTRFMNTVDPAVNFGAMNMARGTADMVGPVPAGGATERWRPLYRHALNMLGMWSQVAEDKMMYQMFRESSGNPLSYAIDSNYYAGHPSKGLLQTIPSTFKGNAPAGYNTNIWDPLSNALASLVYVSKTYGGPEKYPGGAYFHGGIVDGVPAMLTPGEAVISPWSSNKDRQKSLVNQAASWFGGNVTYGPGHSTPVINVAAPVVQVYNYLDATQIDSRTTVLIDGRLFELGQEINRQNGRVLA